MVGVKIMPYYKDTNNNLHFLESATQERNDGVIIDNTTILPSGCIEITDTEAQALITANEAAQIAALASLPNPVGFTQAIKSELGGIVAVNTLVVAYPLFFDAVATQQWADVKALIIDAKAKNVVSTIQYAAIKAAATAFNIPITLL